MWLGGHKVNIEVGITSRNVDDMLTAKSKEVKRILGVEGILRILKFGYNIIKEVGNYVNHMKEM